MNRVGDMTIIDSVRRRALDVLSPSGTRARLTILTFHQVPEKPDPMAPGLPDAKMFAQQMQWLNEYCNLLSLPEAAHRIGVDELPSRAACVTFDDGYANNYDVARPILQDLKIPATFFVTGGAVDFGVMWNDLVVEGLRRSSATLDLTDLGLGVFDVRDLESKRAVVNRLLANLKYLDIDVRWRTARKIFDRSAGLEIPRLMMSKDQIVKLSSLGFDIGAHTISHPILKELATDEAVNEIERSRDWVIDVTGKAPVSFAYPNGRPDIDFDESHEEMVKNAGFEVAVSTRWACATRDDSITALPRLTPWERNKSGYWSRLAKSTIHSYLQQ